MITFPNCKINLGLHVVGKRPDGYHDLETIFLPVMDMCDELEIVEVESGKWKAESNSDASTTQPLHEGLATAA